MLLGPKGTGNLIAATRIHPITAGRFLAPLEEVSQNSLEFLVLRCSLLRAEMLSLVESLCLNSL
jgi:hypothetical protein